MLSTIFDFNNYINFFLALFVIVNPIGILPIFITMTNNHSLAERNRTNFVANFSVAVILCISLLIGKTFLQLLGISIDSFRIAGGIVIVSIAISMISNIKDKENNKKEKLETTVQNNIGIVPLALPLMAGPGAISSCIVWSSRLEGWGNLLGLILTSIFFAFFCWLLFRSGSILIKYLNQTTINVVTRIIGLLLISLGVEFIITGLISVFSVLL
ncbi:YchE family NAAT transporter [Arsenophonus symbiont of Ornithomya chloropus]|uniref:YchE family NAAT transporter n=1 Tax=Arsenophonus symbiont of Ornithomya chloropus TaxID=634121 RepID=UPI0032B2A133